MPTPRDPALQLTPHFHVREFDCRDGRAVPPRAYPGLLRLCLTMLEPLRDEFGAVTITSGYRHRAYNASIGGARQSHHIYDERPDSPAADFVCRLAVPHDWYRFLDSRCKGGLGLYGGFVHVDLRKLRTRWRG